MVFLHFPFECGLKHIHAEDCVISSNVLYEKISSCLGTEEFMLYSGKKKLHKNEAVSDCATVNIVFSLPGGKGGFGSMLRAIGAQIEKTTNREACRDLSGRRLRDINEEQRLKRWISKEAERQADKERRRQERLERLKSKPRHNFADVQFERTLSQMPERIDEALSVGLEKVKCPNKRQLDVPSGSKEQRVWLEDEVGSSTSDSGSEEESSPSKKQCTEDLRSENEKITSNEKLDFPISSEESSEMDLCQSHVGENDTDSSNSLPTEEIIGKDKSRNAPSVSYSVSPIKIQNEVKQNIRNGTSSSYMSSISPFENSSPPSILNSTPPENRNLPPSTLHTSPESNTSYPSILTIPQENKTSLLFERNITLSENGTSSQCGLNIAPPLEEKDESPIDLHKFESISELEVLGLEKLKSALTARGLKCGGSLTDRAQRLWKVRDLQPHEYPANLLAKSKK